MINFRKRSMYLVLIASIKTKQKIVLKNWGEIFIQDLKGIFNSLRLELENLSDCVVIFKKKKT